MSIKIKSENIMNRKKLLLVSIAFFMAAAFSLFPVHHVFAEITELYNPPLVDTFDDYVVDTNLRDTDNWYRLSGSCDYKIKDDSCFLGHCVAMCNARLFTIDGTHVTDGYSSFLFNRYEQEPTGSVVFSYWAAEYLAQQVIITSGKATLPDRHQIVFTLANSYTWYSDDDYYLTNWVEIIIEYKNLDAATKAERWLRGHILDADTGELLYSTDWDNPFAGSNDNGKNIAKFEMNIGRTNTRFDEFGIGSGSESEWEPPSWKNCADYETPYECVGLGMWLCVWDYDTDICVDREVDPVPDPKLESNLKIELERWYASGLEVNIDFAFEWNIEPYLFPPNPYTYESDEVRVVAYKRSTAEYCTYTDNLPPDLEFGWFGKGIKERTTFGTAGTMEDLSDLFCKGAGLYDYRMEIDNHDGSKTSSSIWYQFQYIDDLPASYTDLEEDTWPATLTWYQKLFHNAKENFRHEFNRAYDAFISLFPINWVHGFLSDITYVVFEYEQEDLGYLAMPVSLYWENVREEEDPPDFTVDMLPIEGLVGGTTILGSYTSDFITTSRQIITYVIWIVFAIFIVMRVKSFISGLAGYGESPYSMGFHP